MVKSFKNGLGPSNFCSSQIPPEKSDNGYLVITHDGEGDF